MLGASAGIIMSRFFFLFFMAACVTVSMCYTEEGPTFANNKSCTAIVAFSLL